MSILDSANERAKQNLLKMEQEMEAEIQKQREEFGVAINTQNAFAVKPQELDFVLPGLVAGSVGSIVSPGGAGKSMLALQLSIQIAGGPNFLNISPLKRGRVVYFAAEDPKQILEHRLYHIGSYSSPEERENIISNLVVRSILGKQPNLLEEKWLKHIKSLACESRLIILDTLRRFHLGDENSSSDMNTVLNSLDEVSAETGCAIVFIHHANKGSAYQGTGDMQQASRGSSVLVDNIRWQAFLSTMSKEEAKIWGTEENARKSFVRFGISKQNYGMPMEDKWYRRHEGGILKPASLQKPINSSTISGRENV